MKWVYNCLVSFFLHIVPVVIILGVFLWRNSSPELLCSVAGNFAKDGLRNLNKCLVIQTTQCTNNPAPRGSTLIPYFPSRWILGC